MMLPSGTNTYAGIIVAATPTVLGMVCALTGFCVEVTPQFAEEFAPMLASLVTIGGLAYAAYGRAKATVPGWFAKK